VGVHHAPRDDCAGRTPADAAAAVARAAHLAMRVAPLAVQIIVGTVLLVIVWAAVNWIVQVVSKPTEAFVAVSGSLARVPAQTWRQYGPLFDEHSTAVITPELLAALGQVGAAATRSHGPTGGGGSAGTVRIRTGRASGCFRSPMERSPGPALCIHNHVVVEDGPTMTCTRAGSTLYTRVVPAHAVEMTAALLIAHPRRNRMTTVSLQQRQNLAAIIHLCGDGAGDGYARRGFRF
jgi:hypothetical protein